MPWRAELLGNVIPLGPGPPAGLPIRLDPWGWPGRKRALATADGLFLILDGPAGRHRLLLSGPDPPADGAPLWLMLDRSPLWRPRLAAAARFLAAFGQPMAGLTLSPPPHLSPERQERLAHMLWALELAASGASERDIAALLFGTAAAGPAWSNDPDRAEIRRLLREARGLARGGYRRLLAPPWR